jgi:uncharacterized protein (DUF983 family)
MPRQPAICHTCGTSRLLPKLINEYKKTPKCLVCGGRMVAKPPNNEPAYLYGK